jgi:putative endonuclease
MQNWFLYIVRCDDQSLYTGIATDIERRFDEHLNTFLKKGKKGAKYFYGRKPLAVVHREQHANRSAASKREAVVKKMSRQKKLALISPQASHC